jgi:diguanylate cyclase (GGDEF)-like protein
MLGSWIDGFAVVATNADGAAIDLASRLGAADLVDYGEAAALWQHRLASLSTFALLKRETRRRREAAVAYFNRPTAAPEPLTVRPPVLFVGRPGPHKLAAVDALTGWSVAAYAETSAHARRHLETGVYAAVMLTDIVSVEDLDRQLVPLAAVEGPGTPSFVVFRQRDAAFTAADAHDRGAAEVLEWSLPRDLMQRRLATAIEAASLRHDLRDDAAFAAAVDPISRRLGHSAFHVYLQDQLVHASPRAAFLALALDNLDTINREAGFAAGDRALAAAGHALSRGVRAEDATGRLDGASFGVWFADIGDADMAQVARRLQRRVVRAWSGDAGPPLTARIGWARASAGEDALALTRRARAEARRALLRVVDQA